MGERTVATSVRGSVEPARSIRSCKVCAAIYRTDFQRCPTDGGELAITSGDPLLGLTLAEHYTMEHLIGEGAMGRVYRAHHSRLENRRYAIKVLLGDLAASSTMRMRFAKEAENASRLDHANVVTVIDFGRTATGLMYLVMDLVEGPTLGDAIRNRPMAAARVIRLVRQLCAGLGHAHTRGVVHRDFKPDNILLGGTGELEVPRIADFGLAISTLDDDARLTSSGVLCTPAYAAPEQMLGGAIDHRADLYALGVTMFEMLTGGVLPFGTDAQQVMSRKMAGDRPSLAELAPATPPALLAVVDRLLEREPAERFASAAEVEAALEAPIQPRAITRTAPVDDSTRWRWSTIAAAVGVAMTIGGAVWIARSGDEARTRAPTVRVAEREPPPTPAPDFKPVPDVGSAAPVVLSEPEKPPAVVRRKAARPPEKKPVVAAPEVVVAKATTEPVPVSPPAPTLKPPPAPTIPDPPLARTPKPSPVPIRPPRIAGLEVDGALSSTVVRRAIERVLPDLEACAGQIGTRVVSARFTIEEARRPISVQASGTGAACVIERLSRARTEIAPDVGDARVRLELRFGAGT